MKYDFLILGADGMQGTIVARDLLENGYSVFLADLYKARLEQFIKKYPKQAAFSYVDLRDPDLTTNTINKSGADIVINCAEGDWNVSVYKSCLQTKTHVIDLGSRFGETKTQLEMHADFKKIRKIAITGCGSVPGIGNVMLRYAGRKFDSIDTIEAGFAWTSNIRKFIVPFSIESILEELTWPAPILKNGKWYHKEPLKNFNIKRYKLIGYQKSFLVDHSEQWTFYHYFKDKGVKNIKFYGGFPNHSLEKLTSLIELGLHSVKPIKYENFEIKPALFLTQALKKIRMPRGYKERENLWVEVTGKKNRKVKKILMECLVPPVKGWESAGCNIDTGFPASIIAQMIKNKIVKNSGSYAPEGIIPEKIFFKELRKKQLTVWQDGKLIN